MQSESMVLPSFGGNGFSDPRTHRGTRRGSRGRARGRQAAGPPRPADRQFEPNRLDRRHRRGALGRAAAADGVESNPESRLAAATRVGRRLARDPGLGLHIAPRAGEPRPRPLRRVARRGPARPRWRRRRAQLMLALYRSGRQSEALAAYQDARRTLVDELGIEPGRPLRELHQALLNQDPELDPTRAGADPGTGVAPRSAFVGRDTELAELLSGLREALAGRGGLFFLVGEPGVGKSRLAEETIVRARAQGFEVLVGHCWEAGGAPAYWPWVQSVRSHTRATDPPSLREQLGSGAADLA